MRWTCHFGNRMMMVWLTIWMLCCSTTTWAIRRIPSSSESQRRRIQEEFVESLQRQEEEEIASWTEYRRKALVAEDHLVKSLPLLDEELSSPHYAGHLEASEDDDKKLFYWLFTPEDQDGRKEEDIPLLIWLNGGPACSSMDGLFIETGPFRFLNEGDDENPNFKLIKNPHSWHKSPAYLLFIDQPVGTGLSFTKKKNHAKNDKEINDDFYFFLQKFFNLHKDIFLKPTPNNNNNNSTDSQQQILNRPFFFSGESHAGHYIPTMISYIQTKNKNTIDIPSIIMPITGAAIGNGWVDPYYQYSGAELAYGAGLIDLAQKAKLDQMEKLCQEDMTVRKKLASANCYQLQSDIIDDSFGTKSDIYISSYDYTKYEERDTARAFPPGHKTIESYLGGWTSGLHPKLTTNYKEVLEAIHATESIAAKQRYLECTDPPFMALLHQDGMGVVDDVASILQGGEVKLLFFNGMNDVICNHVGNERFLEHLKWDKVKDWIVAERYAWSHAENSRAPAGYVKEYENLTFLKIKDAGHMVPLDKPALSLSMIKTFLYGSKFSSIKGSQSGLKSIDNTENVDKCETKECQECETPSPTLTPTPPISTIENDKYKNSNIDEGSNTENNSTTKTSFENKTTNNEAQINGSTTSFNVWKGFSIGATIVIVILALRNKRKSDEPFPVYQVDGPDLYDMDIEVTKQQPFRDNI